MLPTIDSLFVNSWRPETRTIGVQDCASYCTFYLFFGRKSVHHYLQHISVGISHPFAIDSYIDLQAKHYRKVFARTPTFRFSFFFLFFLSCNHVTRSQHFLVDLESVPVCSGTLASILLTDGSSRSFVPFHPNSVRQLSQRWLSGVSLFALLSAVLSHTTIKRNTKLLGVTKTLRFQRKSQKLLFFCRELVVSPDQVQVPKHTTTCPFWGSGNRNSDLLYRSLLYFFLE